MTPYYEHAGIAIFHGDCREILRELPRADAMITDPPYGISFAAQPTTGQRRAGMKPVAWDDAPAGFVADFLQCADVIAIWGGNYFELPTSRGWLSWFKPDAPPSMGQLEFCWTNRDMNTRQISCSIAQTNAERVGHPTQKPELVMRWTIQRAAPQAMTIIDPFSGSGTTLVAAKNLGLRAIGIEIEEKYCEMAAKRLSQEVLAFG